MCQVKNIANFVRKNDYDYYTADVAVIPLGNGLNPTMVVEIGVFELQSLNDLAKSYLSEQTNIQVYLAFKFWPLRQDGTAAMLALLYLRENRTQVRPGHFRWLENSNADPNMVISFGNAPINNIPMNFLTGRVPDDRYFGYFNDGDTVCNGAGIPTYQIHIPSSPLFTGHHGGVPPQTPNNFSLDLWTIQVNALYCLKCVILTFCYYIIINIF
jgi:hypothetical protein